MSYPHIQGCHLRIARPTRNLSALKAFYILGLGFELLTTFADHAGFDGLILGHPDAGYHLEFTYNHAEPEDIGTPTKENLLVFYLPDETAWESAVERMEKTGFESVLAGNPYWDVRGRTFEDADGWRVVLQNAGWSNAEVLERGAGRSD